MSKWWVRWSMWVWVRWVGVMSEGVSPPPPLVTWVVMPVRVSCQSWVRWVIWVSSSLSRKHRDSTENACPIPASVGELGRLPDDFRVALNEHVELMVAQLSKNPSG